MNILVVSYGFVVLGWVLLLLIAWRKPQAVSEIRRALWIWFVASLLVFAAWQWRAQWLSLVSLIVALLGISQCHATMQAWLQRRAHWLSWGLIIWILWLATLSLTLAQFIIVWFNVSP